MQRKIWSNQKIKVKSISKSRYRIETRLKYHFLDQRMKIEVIGYTEVREIWR